MAPTLGDDAYRLAILGPLEALILRRTSGSLEIAAFLAADGRVLHTKVGAADEVTWTEAELAPFVGAVALITHNHPRGTSLTPEDLFLAMLLNARELNAFAAHVRYRLYRLRAFWPPRARVQQIISTLEDELVMELRPRLIAAEIDEAEAEMRYYRAMWQRFAHRLAGTVGYSEEPR